MKALQRLLIVALVLPVLNTQASNFYVGVQGGYGIEKEEKINLITDTAILLKDHDTGVMSIKAGYDFNRYLGAEIRLGKANQRSIMKQHASAYAKIQYPLANDLTFYGLIGSTSARLAPEYAEKENANSLSYGAGMRIPLSDVFGLNIEYIQQTTHKMYELKSYQVGMDYRF